MVASVAQVNQQNPALNQASGTGVLQRITQAIQHASARTGVDFSYLLNKAVQESSLNPNAKASTSSATGLFQFTQQTWLQMVKEHGDDYGLGMYANHIKIDINGVARVSDPNMRHAILTLRKDPAISAVMAGELDKANLDTLKTTVGGKIGPTELYLAHFLGAGGATEFLNRMRANPQAVAADVLPDAAASNPAVFYAKDGEPRSVAQIYKQFARKFDNPPKIHGVATLVADATPPAATLSTLAGTSNAQPLPYTSVSSTVTASNYTPSFMNDIKPFMSSSNPAGNNSPAAQSLFTTMVLAQMQDMAHLSATNDRDRKDNEPAAFLDGIS